MAKRVCRRAGIVAAAWLLAGASAHGAGKPTVSIQINEVEVRLAITLPMPFLDALVRIERKDADFIAPDERARVLAALDTLFKEKNPVTIDGIRVRPVIGELEFVSEEALEAAGEGVAGGEDPVASWLPPEFVEAAGTEPNSVEPPQPGGGEDDRVRIAGGYAAFVLTCGTKGKPSQVSLTWELFPNAEIKELRAGLVAFGEFREIRFTPRQREFTWHALEEPSRRRPLGVVHERPGPGFVLPLVSLGLLGGVIVALVALRRSEARRRIALAAPMVSALALVIAASGSMQLRFARDPRPLMPSDEEAARIFEALHRNIYRAFDYVAETDVYDALAQSVAGDLLDETYREIYESLVLADQGGAVCRVQTVDVVEKRVEPYAPSRAAGAGGSDVQPEDGPGGGIGFGVWCHWLVNGSVTHWGHTHFRTNEYRAVYTVEPRGRAWKITAVAVLQHERIDAGALRPVADDPTNIRDDSLERARRAVPSAAFGVAPKSCMPVLPALRGTRRSEKEVLRD